VKTIVDLVAGARPNFMKLAPVMRAIRARGELEPRIIHTGQHYDYWMNDVFFEELGIPQPDVHLEVGSGSHGAQTARILERYEEYLMKNPPGATVVFGDVNSTVACALAAVKLEVSVVHVEAGLRSFDRTMPEEINRILTDSISDQMFVTEQSGIDNLRLEGANMDTVHLVGNVMIDSLVEHLQKAKDNETLSQFPVDSGQYVLMTLHRPSNVDSKKNMDQILSSLSIIEKEIPVIFPIHPRTRKMISEFGLDNQIQSMKNLFLSDPLGYLPFLSLMSQAKMILTDSGGIQEETTFLQIPCLTLRENTERPITAEIGSNKLVGMDQNALMAGFREAMNGASKQSQVPPLWDGKASERIVNILSQLFS